jgi:hypothetical protein
MNKYIPTLEWIELDPNPITNIKLKKQVEYDIENLPDDYTLEWHKVREVYTSHWLNDQQAVDYQIMIGKFQITVQKINSIVYDVSVYEVPFK